MVAKINISLKNELLERTDKAARDTHLSRSGLIAHAIERFLEELEEEKDRQQRLQAAETIIKIADEIGPWDGATEVLKWRAQH